MTSNYKCPKCEAPVFDWYFPHCENPRAISKFSSSRFHCLGNLIEPRKYPELSTDHPNNRTRSCGDFGLEDLDVEYSDD